MCANKNVVSQLAKYLTVLTDLIKLTKTVLILLKKTVVKILVRISNVMKGLFLIQINTNLPINVNPNAVCQLVKSTIVLLDTI